MRLDEDRSFQPQRQRDEEIHLRGLVRLDDDQTQARLVIILWMSVEAALHIARFKTRASASLKESRGIMLRANFTTRQSPGFSQAEQSCETGSKEPRQQQA